MSGSFGTCFNALGGLLAQASTPAAEAASSGVGLQHYLVISALVFGLGLLIIITRRSTIAVLMGIELLLN